MALLKPLLASPFGSETHFRSRYFYFIGSDEDMLSNVFLHFLQCAYVQILRMTVHILCHSPFWWLSATSSRTGTPANQVAKAVRNEALCLQLTCIFTWFCISCVVCDCFWSNGEFALFHHALSQGDRHTNAGQVGLEAEADVLPVVYNLFLKKKLLKSSSLLVPLKSYNYANA